WHGRNNDDDTVHDIVWIHSNYDNNDSFYDRTHIVIFRNLEDDKYIGSEEGVETKDHYWKREDFVDWKREDFVEYGVNTKFEVIRYDSRCKNCDICKK